MVTALVAELPPQTPTPVSEAFVMVLVGFGVDWVAMWRRPAWLFSFFVVDGMVTICDLYHSVLLGLCKAVSN